MDRVPEGQRLGMGSVKIDVSSPVPFVSSLLEILTTMDAEAFPKVKMGSMD